MVCFYAGVFVYLSVQNFTQMERRSYWIDQSHQKGVWDKGLQEFEWVLSYKLCHQ